MGLSTNMRLLLAFALVLAVIKFALLPVLEWQNQTIDEIQQLEQRNGKAENLLANKDQIFVRLAALNKGFNAKKALYPMYQDKTSFRLETQILFELFLKQSDLRQTQFFWRESEDTLIFDNLYKSKFNINFSGLVKDFVLLHTKLTTLNRQFNVANMLVSINGQTETSLGYMDATFTVETYYWLGGQQ